MILKERADDDYLRILQILSRKLMDDSFREQLLNTGTRAEAINYLVQFNKELDGASLGACFYP
ncbi:PTS sugar transporter subunit IIA [Virgibacillus sp. NKC19-3]|uniref:PTS sugar transporter subunit IIA n=1 Tax=Virgibacillus saliphilus TaxID=2831674 RepID=UPI001C9BA8DE|nr:PTS sugar transporter subunit IIA [Virgibacillus sp. NKC19-3]MBY7142910.1 PTS sugar transporter subunit IIA [Virgibacillus sp. NKC19-3]